MRTQEEIQRAHDILISIALNGVDIGFDAPAIAQATTAARTLCWILKHEDDSGLATILELIEKRIKERGIIEEQAKTE